MSFFLPSFPFKPSNCHFTSYLRWPLDFGSPQRGRFPRVSSDLLRTEFQRSLECQCHAEEATTTLQVLHPPAPLVLFNHSDLVFLGLTGQDSWNFLGRILQLPKRVWILTQLSKRRKSTNDQMKLVIYTLQVAFATYFFKKIHILL